MVNIKYLLLSGDARMALLEMNNSPVNGMSHGLRRSLMAAFDQVEAEAGVVAIALTGHGKLFCGGADVREFGTPASAASPDLRDVLGRILACSKPSIALLNGAALGGGLELAMACSYRLARKGVQLALPEVKLGLIPGAWGTQLLPRLIGVARALELVSRGESISSEKALELGLVDALEASDLEAALVGFVEARIGRDAHPDIRRRTPRDVHELPDDWFEHAREALRRDFPGCPAPLAGAEAVSLSATLPFDAAVQRERALFVSLMNSPESAALRYIFFAERESARVPGLRLPAATPSAGIPVAADAPFFSDIPGAIPAGADGSGYWLETRGKGRLAAFEWVACALRAADEAGTPIHLILFRRDSGPACVEVSVPENALPAAVAHATALARRLSGVVVATRASDDGGAPLLRILRASVPSVADEGALDSFRHAADAALASGGLFRAADVDVVAVHLLGYPRHRGGPCYQRDLDQARRPEAR